MTQQIDREIDRVIDTAKAGVHHGFYQPIKGAVSASSPSAALEAAGAFDNRPTWNHIVEVFTGTEPDGIYFDATLINQIVSRLDSAELVQPKRKEPDYTEDELHELGGEIDGMMERGVFPIDIARYLLQTGYRKRTEGGRDG